MEQTGRMHDLAIVLERLWKFYEAMHSGKPLSDGDQMLGQIGGALRNSVATSPSSPEGPPRSRVETCVH